MPQPRITIPSSIPLPTSLLAHAGFVLTGVVTTMLGPLLPALKDKWDLTDSQAGYLFTAQFATSVVATFLLTLFVRRIGYVRMLASSYLLMALGVGGLAANSWSGGVVAVSAWGFALGLALPGTNLMISETAGPRRASALNILNFVWCTGAVACPLVVMLVVQDNHTGPPGLGLAAMLAIVGVGLWRKGGSVEPSAVVLATAALPIDGVAAAPDSAPNGSPVGRRIWHGPFAYLIAALIFLYVGLENSISGWIGAYTKRTNVEMAAFYSLPQAFFWAALMTGRLVAPLWLRRLSEEWLVLATIIVSMAGATCLLATTQTVGLLGGAVLAGAGFAAIYPTTIAVLMKYFGEGTGARAAPVFAMGGLGGAVIPSLVGAVSDHFGSLRAGLVVPLAVAVTMMILQLVIMIMLVRSSRAG